MDTVMIKALLEKYWQAETTVEEERVLAGYFRGPGVDPDLRPYADLFAYFEEESRVSPGPDFEARILQAITPVRQFRWGMAAAAATVLVVVAGLFLFESTAPTGGRGVANPATAGRRIAGPATGNPAAGSPATGNPATAPVADTYDNPEQALAAVRHALLIASVHLNEGRKQISNR
ncbi:MAG TPA: hypothetical protein VHE34_23055 [Puia sp.]|uniref:hypothetical protein n=1 Tax=Puia sp. TaxID=2045100 RepID=UPI002BA2CE28|nr:hypothetical protein [Puia sp.]HVU98129.1 hypothetical protein [Puia sp.]